MGARIMANRQFPGVLLTGMDETSSCSRASEADGQSGTADASRVQYTSQAAETFAQSGRRRWEWRGLQLCDQPWNSIPVAPPDGSFQPVENGVVIRCPNLRWDYCCCQ
jgi:hypothetical protein